jgi:transcriptional regulator with XRE-family HTH domain
MGRAARLKHHYPKRLGEKLLQIRMTLGLSQNGMLNYLGNPKGLLGTSISGYERGVREPPLLILLEYAHIAGVCVDILIDDSAELPFKLPNTPNHKGNKRVEVIHKKANRKHIAKKRGVSTKL